MGYPTLTETGDEGTTLTDDTPIGSPPLRPATTTLNNSRDPLWSISKDEAIRLCRVYEEEMVSSFFIPDSLCLILTGLDVPRNEY